ncbi:MAG: DNA repair protein RecN [Candidatus Latescibacteria bacterium]|nr:DNA repair protein RecN [Candidatus Latescibacterota bacterium]
MLRRLHIVNYALIEDVEIEFGARLNIITGETGAGKSILIGALGLLLGARAHPEMVRTGADRCLVEGIFDLSPAHTCLPLLADMGVDAADGELILRREVTLEGRGRSFVNGVAVPVQALKQIGRLLVDLHGQHDHQSLLDTERHLDFLDGFGGTQGLVEQAGEAHRKLVEAERALEGLRARAKDLKERRDFQAFQAEEIRAADPKPGEDEGLEQERSVLENAERLAEEASQLGDLLYQAEESVVDRLGQAVRLAEDIARMDASLSGKVEEMRALLYGAEEAGRFFVSYAQGVEANPARLQEVEDRLALLSRLKKKYGGGLVEVVARREALERDLALSNRLDEELASAEQGVSQQRAAFSALCASLSARRREAAGRLAKAIETALLNLGMARAAFRVEMARTESLTGAAEIDGVRYEAGPRGADRAEFHMSTNPGEEIRPLVKVASGGEISRIMLAMKSVLAGTDSVQILIFDEIDIGISGRIAEVVGRKLRSLSRTYQTISITHLPQIAKMADRHFSVYKETRRSRTVTRVRLLEGDERAQELAKLMGGMKISKLTLKHAEEMLKTP